MKGFLYHIHLMAVAAVLFAATVVLAVPAVQAGVDLHAAKQRPKIAYRGCGHFFCPNTGRVFPACSAHGYPIQYPPNLCQF